MANLMVTALSDKCPYCGKGQVFQKRELFKMPRLNHSCSHCKHDFTGEPGYYFGAMYVSYAFSVAMGIGTFLICRFIIGMHSWPVIIAIIAGLLILTSVKNYKVSRILWLKIFPPDPHTNMQKSDSQNI